MPNEITGSKISALPAASAASDSDVLAGVQSNTTKKFSLSVIKAWVKGWISKTDVGLGNVENERQYSSANPQPANKTTISTETATAMSGILQGTGSAVTALPFDSAAIENNAAHVPSSAAVKSAIDASANFGICDTAASTQTKTVSIPSVTSLYAGLRVTVKFVNSQNYSGSPKLNVSGTGAVDICSVSGTLAARYEWGVGEVVEFVYDGTYWTISDGGKASTTYYGATKLVADPTSTSASFALTPSAISVLAANSIWGYPVYSKTSTYAVGDRVRYTTGVYECITPISTAESWTAAHWKLIPTLQDQVEQIETDLAGTHITGTTNTTGAAIPAGAYFYLNGILYRAKTQIDVNATFTVNTNCEQVTEGGLNETLRGIDISSYITPATGVIISRAYRIGRMVYICGSVPKFTTANTMVQVATMAKCKPFTSAAIGNFACATNSDLGYGNINISINGDWSAIYSKTTSYGLYFSICYYTVDL